MTEDLKLWTHWCATEHSNALALPIIYRRPGGRDAVARGAERPLLISQAGSSVVGRAHRCVYEYDVVALRCVALRCVWLFGCILVPDHNARSRYRTDD